MTIRRTTYFMQVCERLIATVCHVHSQFLVIYEVFFTGFVAQGFSAKSLDSLDLVSSVTFWLANSLSGQLHVCIGLPGRENVLIIAFSLRS